jgi:hypothetical protein
LDKKTPLKSEQTDQSPYLAILLSLLAVLFLALFFILRYRGMWGEQDTATFTQAIYAMVKSGRLVPDQQAYPNGYGFQALTVFLIQISGVNLTDLQIFGSALMAIWIVLPAWLLYREFTGSNRGAAFATIILLVQPEFLFPILRGTHEKFSRGLMFLCLYMLLRSMRCQHRSNRLAGFVASFYLLSYALITFNNLIFTSFVASLILGFLLGWVISWLKKDLAQKMHYLQSHLVFTTLLLSILAFIFTFYIYSPAQSQLRVFENIWDRMALLFLQLGESTSNPYAVVQRAWVSLPVYFLVSLANWLLLVFSMFIWLRQIYLWLRNQYLPVPNELLLWIFYCSFTILGVTSIVIDISGAIAANLQHRIFPSFAMLAAPIVGKWLADGYSNSKSPARFANPIVLILLAALALLSPLKAINDPIVSNQWIFYLPSEMQAIHWSEGALARSRLWAGFDHRLSSAFIMKTGADPSGIGMDDFSLDKDVRNLLISEVISVRSKRLSQPLPLEADSLTIYDNGQAQIYHLRPKTPFQR